ncbi:MAG: hypothetical protein O7E52_02185 [Candidatus Poribacteria bacterium]|nr:hypothetical protein [Candidatus Poribacteria bacterium]
MESHSLSSYTSPLKADSPPLRRVGFLVFWFSGVLLFAGGYANALPNVTFHFDTWVDFALQRLETDGVTGGIHRHTRPWTRWQVAQAILQAEDRIARGVVEPSQINQQFLEKLKREFKSELAVLTGAESAPRFRMRAAPQLRSRRGDAELAPAFEGAFYYDAGRHITLYQEFETENSPEKYPIQGRTADQRLEPWRGDYTGDFKRVYVRFPVSKFEVLIGRDQIFWGTGFRGAVGISDNSPPFDLILLTGQFGQIKGTAFTAQLDRMWHDQDGLERRYLADRYLSGHRLDWQVNDRIEVGISETILYGGDSRGVEWQYLNPILPYYASQFNADTDDNVMFLLEGAIRPINGLRLYGEWLIDDFQYVDSDDPNAVAWLAGAAWNRLLASQKLSIRGEYARVNRWAYTHLVQENQFTHFGSIIGHRIGTDADTFYLEGEYLINVDARVALFYEFERQGEAGVEDRYRNEDFESIPFPSGVVERRDSIGIHLVYEPLRAWQLNLTYQHSRIKNRNHHRGARRHRDELEFRLRYLWEYRLTGS